jgi:ABC-type enterochelin transport system ATPase subunit
LEIASELPEARISPRLLAAIEHKHSRSISSFKRRLRDEIWRKVVIEIRDMHLAGIFGLSRMLAMEDCG